MELWSKSLWLRIVCPNVSHTSVSWILICLERRRLKSKADRRRKRGSGGGGVKKAKIGNMAKSENNVLWCQDLSFFSVYITTSLYLSSLSLLPSLFPSVSLEACQLVPWLPPRELEDRECVLSSGGRVKDREKMRWRERERERGRVTGGLNNEVM